MKKALVVSDTHGHNENLHKVLKLHPDAMFVIHCGDVEDGDDDIRRSVKCPLYMVAGNNDYFNALPREIEETVFGHRIFITHGHNYGVRYTQEFIMEAAESLNANIAVYGHTHIVEYLMGPPIILNPGSASRPRDDTRGSFMIMELENYMRSLLETAKELRDTQVNMFTTVFIGSSRSEIINNKLVTPRGYKI